MIRKYRGIEYDRLRCVTYIFAMFYRFGLIDVPEKAKEKMAPVREKKTE